MSSNSTIYEPKKKSDSSINSPYHNSPSKSTLAVSVANLSKIYNTGQQTIALNNVNLSIEKNPLLLLLELLAVENQPYFIFLQV